jgi:hypothetical protein
MQVASDTIPANQKSAAPSTGDLTMMNTKLIVVADYVSLILWLEQQKTSGDDLSGHFCYQQRPAGFFLSKWLPEPLFLFFSPQSQFAEL